MIFTLSIFFVTMIVGVVTPGKMIIILSYACNLNVFHLKLFIIRRPLFTKKQNNKLRFGDLVLI